MCVGWGGVVVFYVGVLYGDVGLSAEDMCVGDEFEREWRWIVRQVTGIVRDYRKLERDWNPLRKHKKMLGLCDRARNVVGQAEETRLRVVKLVHESSTETGSPVDEDYLTSYVDPVVEYTVQAISDLACRSRVMQTKEKEVAENFQCSICLDMLYFPVNLMCYHRFCKHCLVAATKKDKRCPICRQIGMACSTREDYLLNLFLKRRYPQKYRERQREVFELKQLEYQKWEASYRKRLN